MLDKLNALLEMLGAPNLELPKDSSPCFQTPLVVKYVSDLDKVKSSECVVEPSVNLKLSIWKAPSSHLKESLAV